MQAKVKKQKSVNQNNRVAVPSEEHIRTRASEIYRARIGAGKSGDSLSDWLQAEREVLGQASQSNQNAKPRRRDTQTC